MVEIIKSKNMNTNKMWDAYRKAELIILSCKTSKHIDGAERYVELFRCRFADHLLYRSLRNKIIELVKNQNF